MYVTIKLEGIHGILLVFVVIRSFTTHGHSTLRGGLCKSCMVITDGMLIPAVITPLLELYMLFERLVFIVKNYMPPQTKS